MGSRDNSLIIVHSALSIKNWICNNTSPFIWSSVITRALPELLEYNPKFSAMNINKKTKWQTHEAEIVRFYLKSMFEIKIPTEVLYSNADVEYESFNFFNNVGSSMKSTFKKIFRTEA